MTSRERLIKTINHETPDRVVVDLGGTPQTGIACSTLNNLRKYYGLEKKPVVVQECMQMLGVVDDDVRKIVGADCVGLWRPINNFGLKNENFKPWTMPDGTEVMMAGDFTFEKDSSGRTWVYPQGNKAYKPSAMIPATGDFFDGVDRSSGYDEDEPDATSDYKEQFQVFSQDVLKHIETNAIRLFNETELGIVGVFGGGGFGDAASLPGTSLLETKGIRKMEDFMMAHYIYPQYVHDLFSMQLEVALKNLELYKQAVGDKIQVIVIGGTDFGTQKCEMISKDMFREFYKPYHTKINDWVHKNTNWKTFYHSCGAISNLLDDMVESGVDIINPVQCSADGMDAQTLKDKYNKKIVFWGGGVDTQKVLPFGTKEDVEKEVRNRCEIFNKDGGFVFSAVHNIVAKTPVENVATMFETIKKFK